jgi:AcrR family transcriptional regulator
VAAGALLDEGGLAAVTLRAVGERAGVSRQAPYRHFVDKVDLLSALVAEDFRRLRAAVDAAPAAGARPVDRLAAMTAAYVRFAFAAPQRYRLMFGPAVRAGLHAEVHAEARALGARFVDAVAAGQAAGVLAGDDPLALAALLYATSHGAVDLALAGHVKEASGHGDPERLICLLLHHLGRHAPRTDDGQSSSRSPARSPARSRVRPGDAR